MSFPNFDHRLDEPDEPRFETPQATVRVCIECGGVGTHALNGWRYCYDHYREQATVVMGLMADQRDAERCGK